MTEIKVFYVGPLFTNCYLITDTKTGEMAVVDPGGESGKLVDTVNNSDGELKYVILTHGHYDHIGFAEKLAKMFSAKIVCSKLTDAFLSDPELNHSAYHPDLEPIAPFSGDILLSDGDKFKLGETEISYIATPGHTRDSGCYIFDDVLVSGDTLFRESFGRTDLPTGSDREMIDSLRRLKKLDGDFTVLPGHGATSTLEFERRNNYLMSRL